MNEIEIRKENLPVKIDDLNEFLIIGKAVLEAHRQKIKAINKLDKAQDAYEAALEDGQVIAEVLLDAETRRGEFLSNIPKKRDKQSSGKRTSLRSLPKGVTKKQSHHSQQIFKHPEIVEKCKEEAKEKGELVTAEKVVDKIKEEADQAKAEAKKVERAELIVKVKAEVKDKKLYELIHDDLANVVLDEKVHAIITDPPYPKEFIDVFDSLSLFAKNNLVKGGVLICLTGQSYLPEYINKLSEHLDYRWMMAYMTPGRFYTAHQRRINSNWKPILVFTNGKYEGDYNGDVFTNEIPSQKDEHKWQQGLGGFTELIERLTKPGQRICDPMMGSGTTGIAAITQNRYFIGIDIDQTNVDTAEIRLSEAQNAKTETL